MRKGNRNESRPFGSIFRLLSMEPHIRIETLEKELDQKNRRIKWLETQYGIIKSIIATINAQRREEYWRV